MTVFYGALCIRVRDREYICFVGIKAKTETVSDECIGMVTVVKSSRQIQLEVRHLVRGGLPSVHTVHVQATSKSHSSRPLRASWTFVVVDKPCVVTVRWVFTVSIGVNQ